LTRTRGEPTARSLPDQSVIGREQNLGATSFGRTQMQRIEGP
jgi:hypothetical protein